MCACVFVCVCLIFRVCLLLLLAMVHDGCNIAPVFEKIEYYPIPPEIFPRLARRGVIEVERQKAVSLEECGQKFNAKAF